MDFHALLRSITPRGRHEIVEGVAIAMEKYLPQYGIASTLRVAHFVAQAAHESDGFKTLTEYASGKGYEGRKDLGNVRQGDGVRFKGRGIFQCTGRVNYAAYGKKLGLDLVTNPDLAADPEVSVRIACEYWKAKGLNTWADRDDVREITRRINGGFNGLAQRQAYLAKAKAALARNDVVAEADPAPMPVGFMDAPHEEVPDAPIAAEPESSIVSSKIAQAGAGVGALGVTQVVSGANDAINQVKQLKDSAGDIGVGTWLFDVLKQPTVLMGIVIVLLVALIIYWRWRDHGAGRLGSA